jgi:hypothetical protein
MSEAKEACGIFGIYGFDAAAQQSAAKRALWWRLPSSS